ncbi:MAG: hypothetical protein DMG70_00150 [Acidobacteria bacterium]|nr:MAG: hypothetical protein DMG70_00150 [Acidobacteriota bacterium]PYY06359.1 MAG: hypothetical protein DMG69_23615 [Acidobacteriota bacterium]
MLTNDSFGYIGTDFATGDALDQLHLHFDVGQELPVPRALWVQLHQVIAARRNLVSRLLSPGNGCAKSNPKINPIVSARGRLT